jgi:putative ABC transport system permease protein
MSFLTRFFLVFEGVGIALESLRTNKVRAFLTIAGVAIGVFVVVTMAAAVNGIRRSFEQDLENIGAETFQVFRRSIGFQSCDGTDDTCPDRRNPPIRFNEWKTLQNLPSVESVIGSISGGGTFTYRDQVLQNISFDAYSPDWLSISAADIAPGRNFTANEHDAGRPVVLINDTLRAQLFSTLDPIGKQIRINGAPFTVIGIYNLKAGFIRSLEGRGPDTPRAIVPLNSAIRNLDLFRNGLSLAVRPRPGVARDVVVDDVVASLRAQRGLKPSQINNFEIVPQERLLETFDQLFGAIFAVGLALSAVALLVGGVGVVGIMMISVTERTREIGVRKALGATRGTILWQFLVEAATLTLIGAASGLLVGAGLTALIRNFSSLPAELPISAVIAALVGAAVTGVAFGMLPALRASRLDPVEALRHE